MRMRIVVITGASGGIGRELLRFYEEKGDKVYNLSRTNPSGGGNFIKCDVTQEAEVEAAINSVMERDGKIDVLINNAGVGTYGAVEFLAQDKLFQGTEVNYYGSFFCAKHALRYMRDGAKIINISSACALFPLPFKEVYCGAKAAVNMLAYGLRMELSDTEIQVATVCPGDIKSNFSANRVKDYTTNEKYGTRIRDSAEKLDAREEKRMSAEYAAKKIFKFAERKRLKPMKIIGAKYKLFYIGWKLLPLSLFLKLTNRMLGR